MGAGSGLKQLLELARLTLDGSEASIERVLALARAQLDLDLAFLSVVLERVEVVDLIDGEAERFGIEPGSPVPFPFASGEPLLVVDAAHDPRITAREAGIGAYVGVPVRLIDGRYYGTLGCLGSRADWTLNTRDVKFVQVLAEVIAEQLERQDLELDKRRVEARRIWGILESGSMRLLFQPVFSLARLELVAFEALARFPVEPWRPPSAWFAEAAEVGLTVDLELAAIGAAIARLGDLPPHARLCVNLSPATLVSPELHQLVHGVAERIDVELTEHAPVEDYEALSEALTRLREHGARLAIDDVGAGFASLRHILRLAPDVVKLDVSLTRDIEVDAARSALTSALVAFTTEIDAQIVAEGIENEHALELLRSLGVGFGQGFFLGEPAALTANGQHALH